MRRWRSGQSHLTVNQTTYVYAGSNPARRTNDKNLGYNGLRFLFYVAERFEP